MNNEINYNFIVGTHVIRTYRRLSYIYVRIFLQTPTWRNVRIIIKNSLLPINIV